MKIKAQGINYLSKLRIAPTTIFNVSAGAISILLGLTSLLGAPSPFAVAFVASLPTRIGAISFVFSSLGYVLGFGFQEALSYIFSMVFILISKNLLEASRKLKLNCAHLPVLVGACYFLMNLLIAIAFSKSTSEYFLIVLDSILCGGVCFCFATVTKMFLNDNKKSLSLSEITGIAVLSMLGLICIAHVNIGIFNLGTIVALIVVVVATYCVGSIAGVVVCALSGAAMTLYDRSAITFFAVVGFCSLISGVFRFWGKIGQVAVLIFSSLVSIMVVGVSIEMLELMLGLLIALTVFLVIPQTLLEKITLKAEFYFSARNHIDHRENSKMKFASNTLVNLKSSFEQAYEKLYRKKLNNTDSIVTACSNKICKKCPKSTYCWIDEYNTTVDHFYKIVAKATSSDKFEVSDMPDYMQKNCIRTMAVANFISSQSASKAIKNSEIEQFQSCVDMLCDITDTSSSQGVCDQITAELVKDAFVQFGLTPSDVIANVDLHGRTSIDVFFVGKVVCDTEKIAQALSGAIGKNMQSGDIAVVGLQSKLSFFDKPEYAFRSYVIQKPARIGDKCGDSICAFTDGKAVRHVVLSDGMGTGGQAALDSAITVDFIKNLIISGFDYKNALQFINSSLQMRAEESLSTVDVLTVDLYSGRVGFKKAGSASSFIKHGGDCINVKTQSLPIGIIGNIDFDEQEFELECGDIVVMVSDGVIESSSEWLVSYLQESECFDIEKTCKDIYKLALEQSEVGHSDDMTIMVGMLVKN